MSVFAMRNRTDMVSGIDAGEGLGTGGCDLVELEQSFALRPVGSDAASDVLRSRQLAGLTARQARLLCGLGVEAIYDLRKPLERSRMPIPSEVPLRIVNFSEDLQGEPRRSLRTWAGVSSYGDPGDRPRAMYRHMAWHGPLFGRVVRGVADSTGRVIVSCAYGKDRTGVACAVLMKAAGASDSEILDDYLFTNVWNAGLNARDLAFRARGCTARERAVIRSMFIADESYLEAFFDEIDRLYGSFEAYRDEYIRVDARVLAERLHPSRPRRGTLLRAKRQGGVNDLV